jgi:hypothetical protein
VFESARAILEYVGRRTIRRMRTSYPLYPSSVWLKDEGLLRTPPHGRLPSWYSILIATCTCQLTVELCRLYLIAREFHRMTTEKWIDANRRNAQLTTGPKPPKATEGEYECPAKNWEEVTKEADSPWSEGQIMPAGR